MKQFSLAFLILSVLFISFFSCKKINEATDLGGGLIPGVDNINTFEIALNSITNNALYNDTVKVGYSDQVALGDVNDPEFGHTHANLSFTITPSTLGVNPFGHKDSVVAIDSVVLSLSYRAAWGDTVGNGIQTLRVYEIAQNSGFRDDTVYRYKDPASDFTNATTGGELGSKTYAIKNVKDTILVKNPTGDTSKLTNVVRIRLNNSIGQRFAQYDTTSSTTTGGFHADETQGEIFRDLFKGLAIKADNSGNALAYFSLSDISNTRLIVYFKRKLNGDTLSTSTDFVHRSNGRTNYIAHTPGSNWASQLANGNPSDSLIYLQGSPSGSHATVVIPGLNNFGNKVIHLAELIAVIPPQFQSLTYTPPSRLFLDRKKNDSTYMLFERDIPVDFQGSLSLDNFGGALKSNAYKFNITRYVQNIVTRGESNDTLRLYAPFRTRLAVNASGTLLPEVNILERIATGRVILGGGTLADSSQRLRLRIIYSNL